MTEAAFRRMLKWNTFSLEMRCRHRYYHIPCPVAMLTSALSKTLHKASTESSMGNEVSSSARWHNFFLVNKNSVYRVPYLNCWRDSRVTWSRKKPKYFTFISTNECLLYIMGAEFFLFRHFQESTKVRNFLLWNTC